LICFLSVLNWLVSLSALDISLLYRQKSSSVTSVTRPALAALMAASVLAFGRGTAIGNPPVSTTLRKNKRIAVLTSKPTALSTAAASRFSSGSTRERTSTVITAYLLTLI
jgi:hypothetical protein